MGENETIFTGRYLSPLERGTEMKDGDVYIDTNTNSIYVYMNGMLTISEGIDGSGENIRRQREIAERPRRAAGQGLLAQIESGNVYSSVLTQDSQSIEYYKLQMAMEKEEEPEEIEFLGNIEK